MPAQQHVIMTKALPEILDDLEAKIKRAEAAAADAEGHSKDAKAYADAASGKAGQVVKEEIDKILPRITEAQGTAGQALAIGKAAALNAETALGHVNEIYGLIKEVKDKIGALAAAVVNGLKDYAEGIVQKTSSFIKWK